MNRRDSILQGKSSKVQFDEIVRNMATIYDVKVLKTCNFSRHIQSFQPDDDTLITIKNGTILS